MSKQTEQDLVSGIENKVPRDDVPVYPGLLFKELLAVLLGLLVLALLGLLFDAPLDVPADSVFTPNPAKAPWYFLGIQELLVYFDPWFAGVVIPLIIVLGLVLVPFLDNDPKGSGVYAFRKRVWATLPFTAGLVFIILLMSMAAIFRGSNWDWYWPWEDWAMARPARIGFVSLPAWLGLSLTGLYYLMGLVLPSTIRRNLLQNWGRFRYFVYFFLALTMGFVMIKVLLRLFFNVRYFIVTPWFNI